MRRPARRRCFLALLAPLAPAALVACSDVGEPPAEAELPAATAATAAAPAVDDDVLDVALSEPREDSVYPHVGDPGVDALHYDLSLDWDPVARVLDGRERLVFRSTEDDESFQLDLSPALEVRSVTVDGEPAGWRHDGKDLVVAACP